MSIFFISDLHLSEDQPIIAGIFFKFLKDLEKKAEALYILGDFFEAWVGDDDHTDFNLNIMNALREVTKQGFPIYFMRGNRDFLIGKKFLKATGCQLLPDEYVLNLYGTPTLLMHGDTLCTADKKYLKFRKKTRFWLVQQLFLWKSLAKRRAIAKRYREASSKHISTLPDYIMDVTQAEVARIMQKHKVKHLIHGHTHREAVHTFTLEGEKATRTVLGAWHENGRVLICESDGLQYIMEFLGDGSYVKSSTQNFRKRQEI